MISPAFDGESNAGMKTLVDELLNEQQSLTAVERFSQHHESVSEPLQARYYHDLIPLSKPGKGEQYRFEVDLDVCSGCKACVTACHSLNGLDEGESWRDVGAIVTPDKPDAAMQVVTTACHHCADPACANGCPTLAYEKESDTGVVRHLDDQCIGCQYCTLTCPYEVPKYNDRLGIVRKCDMCQSRLREGEAPACVQACPNEAIKIRIVSVEEVEASSQNGKRLLPGTVESSITKPTTKFVNLHASADEWMKPADHDDLTPAHGHFPLALMLVFTQVGAGIITADVLVRLFGSSPLPLWHALLGAAFCFGGLGAAPLHLGRPEIAWKAFLGWRKSWLSREILAFGPWSGLVAAYVGSLILPLPDWLPRFVPDALGIGAVLTGFVGVFCSMMVYIFTKRPFWGAKHTGLRFGLTAVVAGAVFAAPGLALAALLIKLSYEAVLTVEKASPFKKSARILTGPLALAQYARFGFGLLGAALLVASGVHEFIALAALGCLVLGDLVERIHYFQAVETPKMPGGITAS